jgi:hypothetical protein
MARGNQRENAREAAQKKLGNVVCYRIIVQITMPDLLILFVEEQDHQDWLPAGC